jgi:protocatechuate 3,4-dioxygenase beta subunit
MTGRVLSLVLAVLLQAGGPPAAESKGEIRGRVLDAETGRALPGAVVHLADRDRNLSLAARTDDAGVFRFTGLPPGRYDGIVDEGPFRGSYVFQPLEASAPGRTLTLGVNEIRELQVALPRASAIGVRIFDPDGDPLSDVRVTVRRADGGTLSAVTAMSSWRRTTDDRGWLRVFGLSPGRYTVCAEAEALGQPSAPRSVRHDRLLRTCYPASSDDEHAETITVDRADVGDLEIRMRRGRTFTVAGRLLDASGAPPTAALASFSQYQRNGSSSIGLTLDTEGRFRIADVHPGAYAVEATIGGPERPEQRRPFEIAFLPVHVEDADVEDLLVMMKKGVDVQGRVSLEDPSLPFPAILGSGLIIGARLADDRLAGQGSTRTTIMRADRSFTLDGLFGRRELDFSNVPRGWYVKSIRYGGRDVIDEPVEFKDGGEASPLEIVLSNRGAVIGGRAVDQAGTPSRALILAFRVDDKDAVTLAATATAAPTGAFRIGPLRGGNYRIVALPSATASLQSGEWDRTARLAALADRLTLGELEDRTIELTIVAERKDRF